MKERFIVRREYFGGVIYDSDKFDFYCLDNFAVNFLESVNKKGLFLTIKDFECEYDIEDFVDYLKKNGIIQNNKLNALIISNTVYEGVLSAPLKVFLTITDRCNLYCKHCFGDFGDKKRNELDFTDIKSILLKLKDAGVFQISITGGEPLYHNDILKILKEVVDMGFTCQITTNGTMFNREIIEFVKNNNFFRFSVSLEGLEEYHDSIRGIGNYQRVLSNIYKLIDQGISFGVNTVLSSKNIDDFDLFLRKLRSIGVRNLSTSLMLPSGRAIKNSDFLINPYDDNMKKKVFQVIDSIKSFAIETECNQYAFGKVISKEGFIIEPHNNIREFMNRNRCNAGSIIATIKANGDLIPCVFMDHIKDLSSNIYDNINLLNGDLFDIWQNHVLFSKVRKIEVSDDCTCCKMYNEFKCKGGCPILSYYYKGDFGAMNPFCGVKNASDV